MNKILGDHSHITTVLTLARAHLRHEWVLTLCLVAALAAVMSPLLILMGLKEGVVSTLRNRLVEDPAFREIRPAVTKEYSQEWLSDYRKDKRVKFIVPGILPASSIIYMVSNTGSDGEKIKKMLDLIPTADGDTLLLENNIPVPQKGECVLTHSAANQLQAEVGDVLTAQATRSMQGKSQQVEEQFTVVGVLPVSANSISGVYTPLAFVEDVEAYKEGRNIASRGWQGNLPYPHMSFDSTFVLVAEALDKLDENELIINTGYHQIKRVTAKEFSAISGLKVPDGWSAYYLTVVSGDVTISSVEALTSKLRGKGAVILPYADNIKLEQAGNLFPLFGLSLDNRVADKLGWPNVPWGKLNKKDIQMPRILQMFIGQPLASTNKPGELFNLLESNLENFPLKVNILTKDTGLEVALVPTELLGMLHTAKKRQVVYSEEESALILKKAGYRGFRLYTNSIDDVPSLVADFRTNDDLEVIAEVGAIERIQVLDKGLTRLFWLIAVLGIIGAGAVLIASLYAAVERETKNLGTLRLLGLSRTDVFWFPVFEGIIISAIGMTISILCYLIFSQIINYTFGGELPGNEAICRLPFGHIVKAILAVLTLSVLSSFLAAWKTTNIETAEAIREE